MRKYPVAPILLRTCCKDYVVPGTTNVIEKGMNVLIPAFAMHRDEKFYEKPLVFDPDWFNEANRAGSNHVNQPSYGYGDGPRNCVGMRLGQLQVMVSMLQKFRYELNGKLKNEELKFDPKDFLLASKERIKFHVFYR